MGYLIDSNVLIDYVAERFSTQQLLRLDAILDVELNVSIIVKIETLGFNAPLNEEQKLVYFFGMANVIALTNDISNLTISLRKTVKLKTPDAIIAATALVHNHTLLTHNLSDFKNVPNLIVVDPYTL